MSKIIINETEVEASDYSYPSERTFRNAWAFSDDPAANIIEVDMEAAKDLWRDKIRRERKKPLQDLDTAYMKALETGADTSQIIAEKQALRDAPQLASIEAATTPEELVAIQPIPGVTIL